MCVCFAYSKWWFSILLVYRRVYIPIFFDFQWSKLYHRDISSNQFISLNITQTAASSSCSASVSHWKQLRRLSSTNGHPTPSKIDSCSLRKQKTVRTKKSTVLECPTAQVSCHVALDKMMQNVHPAGYSWHLPPGHLCLYLDKWLACWPLDVSGLGLNAPFYFMHPPQKNDNWYSKVVLTFPIPAPKLMGLRWSKACPQCPKSLNPSWHSWKPPDPLGFLRKNAPNSLVISPFPIRICCHSI